MDLRVALPKALAILSGTRRMKGIGYQIIIPEMLKNKWARATWSACTLSETNEARSPVTVVPMFAPRVKGNICSRWIAPTPTKGVKTEVVIEED